MGTQQYTFTVDSFTIRNTRSLHQDTDYVSATIVVGNNAALKQTKAMGDLNNGTFNPGIVFDGIPVADDQNVVFTYAIVNSGHSNPSDVEKALETAVSTLGDPAAKALASGIKGPIGDGLGALAKWLVTEIGAALFANCDGPVAAGVHIFSGADLRTQTNQGAILHQSDNNPGTDSPTGCGSNSQYVVNWSIRFREFAFQGPIRDKWNALGGQAGLLGYPQTDDTTCPDGYGHFVHFQNGSIYWTPQTGAFSVHGLIRGKWAALGWERCPFLGYPITDETGCPDGVGRFNHFQNGSIYWTPQTGAFSVHGAIRALWASLGWEKSSLGYPTSDEVDIPGGSGRMNQFQHGRINWQQNKGAWVVASTSP